METKKPSESETYVERMVLPEDMDIYEYLYGGRLMEWIDNCASIVATKHCRKRTVTGSIDSLFFLLPIHLGDMVILHGYINYTTKSTMEIEIDVIKEEGLTGIRRYATKAYLTYVAIDSDGRPTEIPQIVPETDEEKRRYQDAEKRAEERRKRLEAIKQQLASMVP
ncbi:MAG: acyl-CoA thioesterase [Thermoplasma acidophilum]|nr:acyl-CoA thioesterase [Thermoplasma acidophilum]